MKYKVMERTGSVLGTAGLREAQAPFSLMVVRATEQVQMPKRRSKNVGAWTDPWPEVAEG